MRPAILISALILCLINSLCAQPGTSNDPQTQEITPIPPFEPSPADISMVLIFQDQNPWGYTSNQQILTTQGVPYIIAPHTAMATINMLQYDVIIMASQQPTAFYQAYQAQLTRFEDYLNSGGVLEFHCATWGSYFMEEMILPGGISHNFDEEGTNYVVNQNHPLTFGLPDTLVNNSASHEHFQGLLPGTDIITVDDDSSHPTTIEYQFGAGVVIATGQTWEWVYHFNSNWMQILPNAIAYSLSLANGDSLELSLSPLNPPIQIPASGGSFNYTVQIQSLLNQAVSAEFWISVMLPNGNLYGPLVGPANITIPSGATVSRTRTQNIPGSAPAGTYYYRAYIGDYFTAVWEHDSYAFTKLAAGDWGAGTSDWESTGEEFAEASTTSSAPASALITTITPNPFNPTTSLRYELPVGGFVNLQVYDLTGRLVSELVNGRRDPGSHEVTFDGSRLVSGVYLYRLQAGEVIASGKMVLMK